MESSTDELMCVICYDSGEMMKSLPCECKGTLSFHPKCFDELKTRTHTCPTCKTDFKLPDGPAIITGSSTLYDDDEYSLHVTIKDSKWDGPVHAIHNLSGRRKMTLYFKNGVETGETRHYYLSGVIKDAYTVGQNYRIIGPFMSYYPNGTVRRMGYFKDSRKEYEYCYNEDGKLMCSFHIRRRDDGKVSHIERYESSTLKLARIVKNVLNKSIFIKLNFKDGLKIRFH
jgi:antitoxin component YwqK of YwqJK toxin-antitoxin module